MRLFGIERQAQLIALIPIMVIAALLESYFIYARFDDLDRALLERSQLLTRQLASSSEYAVFSGDAGLLKQHVDSALSFQDVSAISVLDAAFNPLLRVGQGKHDLSAQHPVASQIDQDSHLLRLYEPITPTQIKLEQADLQGNASQTPSKPLGMVVIEFSKSRLNQQKTEIIVFNLLITLTVLSATLMISLRVARKISQPILGMRHAIIGIGEGELHTRISPKPMVRELYELADGINKMALQLQLDRSTLQDRINHATSELRTKKEEAEKASFSKTRFLAAASHDLRQPMHALGLFIGELQATINTEEQRKIVLKVEESVEAMSGLLNSLLDISKLDAGLISPQAIEFNVGIILDRIAHDYQAIAASKSIKLKVVPCNKNVSSDPVLLERILVNLISNALRYTQLGGHVFVGCRKRGDNLRIEIRDNGIGIPADEQKNIFLEFVQLANKERDRSMGLGLGLAIVERLSKLLQHPIAVRSKLGKGSLFSIDIPLARNSVPNLEINRDPIDTQPIKPVLTEQGSRSRILVVDDDSLVRTSTQGVLSSWGYEVYLATSLHEVKSKFGQQGFDLVICDYRLPDGTGLEVVNFIAAHQHEFTPCILISGDTSPDVLKKVTESGFNLLSKPVRPAKLRSLLHFLLTESKHTV